MPLTRRQFDLGINDKLEAYMRAVHSHLATNPGLAFTSGEIADAVHIEGTIVMDVLDKLEEIGAVESRRVNSYVYFAYAGALPDLR